MAKTPAMPASGLAWRGMVAWRAILAVLANYGLAALAAMAIARGLPHLGVPRVEATLAGTLIAIFSMPAIPIFVFAARSAWKPTAVMAACAALLGLLVWLPGAPS
jgi:hypothetical protein